MFSLKVKGKFQVSSIAENDINAKDRRRVESDTEEDAIDTTQKQKKINPIYQVMVLMRVISLN